MRAELESVAARVAEIYQGVAPDAPPISLDGHGQLDSLAFMEFITRLEEEFDITIPTEEVTEENFATARTTAAYIASKLPGGNSSASCAISRHTDLNN